MSEPNGNIPEGALLPLWDDSHMYLWLALFIASAIGLLIYIIWVMKKKK
ncbi:MAG: hypothetical protein LKJ76_06725 [Lachnospiraceae bacterium]|jgi:hypothetical protein|nr:hypothetical protein [Lachnospiraceae bacterium]